MRVRARIDDNQREVVAALRATGCLVQSLATIGGGCPDLLVWSPFTNRVHLIEVKDGRKRPKLRELTPDEKAFAAQWKCVELVLDGTQALLAVGAVRTTIPPPPIDTGHKILDAIFNDAAADEARLGKARAKAPARRTN